MLIHMTRKLDSKMSAREIARETRRVTWVGVGVNLLLAVGKFVGGVLGHSHALVADAVHSLSDLSTDAALLLGVRYWTAPADRGHPYGHARIETMVSVGIGFFLVLVALGIGWDAIVRLQHPQEMTAPRLAALWVAICSIVAKEWVYQFTKKAGQDLHSSALLANAWHHRTDALSSIPVAVAIALAAIHPQLALVDVLGALLVSVIILFAAATIVSPALRELGDAGPGGKVLDGLYSEAMDVEGVMDVHKLRARRMGAGLQADLHVLVDGQLNVREGHDISGRVKEKLLEGDFGVIEALIHIEPLDN